MPDEIIKELWQIKDANAREHSYDIEALVAYLQAATRRAESRRFICAKSRRDKTSGRIKDGLRVQSTHAN